MTDRTDSVPTPAGVIAATSAVAMALRGFEDALSEITRPDNAAALARALTIARPTGPIPPITLPRLDLPAQVDGLPFRDAIARALLRLAIQTRTPRRLLGLPGTPSWSRRHHASPPPLQPGMIKGGAREARKVTHRR